MIVVQPRPGAADAAAKSAARLTLVRQPDHAATCAQLAAAWHRPTEIPDAVWPRFIEAARRHDDGWIAAEREPAVDPNGQPYDFKSLPTQAHTAIWRGSVDLAEAADPYMALLTALHARWLYGHITLHDGEDEQREAQQLMAEMAQRADGYIEALRGRPGPDRDAVQPTALAAARSLLTLFDRLSLMLIGGLAWTEQLGPAVFGDCQAVLCLTRPIESNVSTERARPPASAPTDDGLVVRCDPWPFEATGKNESEGKSRGVAVGCDMIDVDCSVACDAPALGRLLAAGPTHRRTWTLMPSEA